MNSVVSLFCDSNVRAGSYEWSHIRTYTHENYYNRCCAHAHRGLIIIPGATIMLLPLTTHSQLWAELFTFIFKYTTRQVHNSRIISHNCKICDWKGHAVERNSQHCGIILPAFHPDTGTYSENLPLNSRVAHKA